MITMFDAKSVDFINLIDLQWVLIFFKFFKFLIENKVFVVQAIYFSEPNQISYSVESSNVRSFVIS